MNPDPSISPNRIDIDREIMMNGIVIDKFIENLHQLSKQTDNFDILKLDAATRDYAYARLKVTKLTAFKKKLEEERNSTITPNSPEIVGEKRTREDHPPVDAKKSKPDGK